MGGSYGNGKQSLSMFRVKNTDSQQWFVIDSVFDRVRVHTLEDSPKDRIYEIFGSNLRISDSDGKIQKPEIGNYFVHVDSVGQIQAIGYPEHSNSTTINWSKISYQAKDEPEHGMKKNEVYMSMGSVPDPRLQVLKRENGKIIQKQKTEEISPANLMSRMFYGYEGQDKTLFHKEDQSLQEKNLNALIKLNIAVEEATAQAKQIAELMAQVETLQKEVTKLKGEQASKSNKLSETDQEKVKNLLDEK